MLLSDVGRTTCSWTWWRWSRWWWTSGGTSTRPLQSTLVGQMLTLWNHTYTRVLCSTINWRGLQTWRQSTRRAWANFTSWGGSGLLLSATGCSRCSTSLLLLGPSSSLWCPGMRATKRRMPTEEEVVDDRLQLLAIMDNASHPLHKTLDKLKSSFNNRLIQPSCLKEGRRKSFHHGAIRLYKPYSTTQIILCFKLLLL